MAVCCPMTQHRQIQHRQTQTDRRADSVSVACLMDCLIALCCRLSSQDDADKSVNHCLLQKCFPQLKLLLCFGFFLFFCFDFFLLSIKLQVPAGTKEPRPPNSSSSSSFINTPSHSQLLSEMMQSHMVKDICLIGAKVANTHCTHSVFWTHTL